HPARRAGTQISPDPVPARMGRHRAGGCRTRRTDSRGPRLYFRHLQTGFPFWRQDMRILQVTSRYYPAVGGLEIHVQSISETLSRMGHSVTVATPCSNPELPPFETINGVQIYRFPALGPHQF